MACRMCIYCGDYGLMKIPPGIKIFGSTDFRDKNCRKEAAEQKEFFGSLKEARPQYYEVALHPKNEGKRNGKQQQADKDQGALNTGASDIIIPAMLCFVCEVKRKDHRESSITAAQIDYLYSCQSMGAFACIALGADAAWQALLEWEIEYKKIRLK